MHSDSSLEFEIIGITTCTTVFISKDSPDPKLSTNKLQLRVLLSEETYLNLIGRKQSVARVTIANNQNPWPITAVDAVLWTKKSEKTFKCFFLHADTLGRKKDVHLEYMNEKRKDYS